eukprot:2125629-Rhodomonas_salina.1
MLPEHRTSHRIALLQRNGRKATPGLVGSCITHVPRPACLGAEQPMSAPDIALRTWIAWGLIPDARSEIRELCTPHVSTGHRIASA